MMPLSGGGSAVPDAEICARVRAFEGRQEQGLLTR